MLNERECRIWCISKGGWDTWESTPQKQARGNCMIFVHSIGVLVSPLAMMSGHLECDKSDSSQGKTRGNCMIFAHGIGVLVSPLARLSGHLECNKSAGMLCG